MGFTFLHAADLHLGSPLTGLTHKDEDVACRFAAASRGAFSDLIGRAIAERVAFVLIAGDLYDGDWKDMSIGLFFNREIARLARENIPVFVVRGNHDAESEITKAVPLPETVFAFSTRKAETKHLEDLKVAVHGRSFADRVVSENIALTYPAPVSGWFNIGMLHTSCEGHSSHAVYAPCSVQDLVSRDYDYWALGHVHEHTILNRDPWIVYPGNLQGRNVRECGPKGAVLVDVADGRVSATRTATVDRGRWLQQTVEISGLDSLDRAIEAIREQLQEPLLGTGGRLSALRVTLTGTTLLHATLKASQIDLRDEIQAVINHIHEDAWLESVKIRTTGMGRQGMASGDAGPDPDLLLAGLETDPDLRAEVDNLLRRITAKLPGGLAIDQLSDVDAIMADAHALVTARALGAGT